jgi:antitoxin PrlF
MPHVHEVATVTSKGQITLPKPIRQALGIGAGSKVAFELRGSEVVVTRAGEENHADPAIEAFLALLERDIKAGNNLTTLPQDLAQAMLTNLHRSVDLSEELVGDVAL